MSPASLPLPPPPPTKTVAWEERGFRVLVAAKNRYTMGLTVWRKKMDVTGTGVPDRQDIPLKLVVMSGGERDPLGWAEANANDIPAPASQAMIRHHTEGVFHELPEGMPLDSKPIEPQDPLKQKIPLYGCQVRLTPRLAEEFGFADLGAMVISILKKALYGKAYAFIDEPEGLKGLLPQFADYARSLKWDNEDKDAVFQFGTHNSMIGPPLSKFEPERFERTKGGRLI